MRARSLLILLAFAFPACSLIPKPKPPDPPAQCPATCPDGQECVDPAVGCVAKGIKHAELEIRRCEADPTKFCQQGKPMDFAGCEECCLPWEDGWGGWPMFSPELAAYFRTVGDCKRLHARPGPFLASDESATAGGRLSIKWGAHGGGPYIEVDGKADLTRFNPAFWDYNERALDDAGKNGMTVEYDVMDRWRFPKNDCQYSPWNPGRNIQGENHCGLAVGDPVQDAWIRQVVLTFGRYANKTYQVGNESGIGAPREQIVAWERWVADRIRFWEREVGAGVVSLIATNSGLEELEADGRFDYVNQHNLVMTPINGKPSSCNELNPAPEDYVSEWCHTEHLWAWRAELPRPAWEAALAGIKKARVEGCKPVVVPPGDACPKPLAEGARVYLNDKPYGNGFDSSVRVSGDPEFCRLIHGVVVNDCHLEGWPTASACERQLMGGCPIWQFTLDGGQTVQPCTDNRGAAASCDHFGDPTYRDDPQTPTTGDTVATLRGFEGRPLECGLQRDQYGPMAGFFIIAHGAAQVRACRPDGQGCGPWRPFDY